MNALTDPLRQVARDLVEKKLWPVALLLVAALVAVPVVIGGSSEAPPAPPATPAAVIPGADTGKSLITVADETANARTARQGRLQDPIFDPPADSGQAADAGVSAVAGAGSGSGAPAAPTATSAPAGTSAPADKPAPGTPAAPSPVATDDTSRYLRTVVRWYASARSAATPIRRLTPLGGAKDPAALYLGVTKSEATYAVFLLAPGATSEGDARCEDDGCRVIGLRKGQSQVVTVPASDGGAPRRYQLDVVSVKTVTTDAETAAEMRGKVHGDGRDVMREMWQDDATADALGPIRYDETLGLLYKPAAAAPEKAAK